MIKSLVKHARNDSFFYRYISQNAENRLISETLQYMLWRKGRFVRPHEKQAVLRSYIEQELQSFYVKNEINLPQLQYAITTRCTLKCLDCNAFFPKFRKNKELYCDVELDNFKNDVHAIMSQVNFVRRFIIIGGEPLMHKELPAIIAHCAGYQGIETIEIITNGTIMPSKDLLEAAAAQSDKVYFHLSNYSANNAIAHRLHYEAIIDALKLHGVKHQMSMNLEWNKELPLSPQAYSEETLNTMFNTCWLKRCIQVLDGKLSLCPKLSSGYALGMLDPGEKECIDLRQETECLRQQLIDFYKKSPFESCRFCTRIDKKVLPAKQML